VPNPFCNAQRDGATMNGMGWGRILRLASGVLALSALLVIAGQVAEVLSFPGVGTRLRLESLSEVANGVSGMLVVGAVILALAAGRVDDRAETAEGAGGWSLVLGGVLGAVLVIAAVYSVIDLLTLHVPSPGATGQQIQVSLSSGHTGWDRVAVILQRGAGGLLGAFAAWVAVMRQRLSAPPQPVSALA